MLPLPLTVTAYAPDIIDAPNPTPNQRPSGPINVNVTIDVEADTFTCNLTNDCALPILSEFAPASHDVLDFALVLNNAVADWPSLRTMTLHPDGTESSSIVFLVMDAFVKAGTWAAAAKHAFAVVKLCAHCETWTI
mmetsp:Transcript_104332/g.200303  ORF Transcript_104332/g.200303 Transcript_104332/m.200303 type:complete len:136 (+) Transcript_104332:481-888(+)